MTDELREIIYETSLYQFNRAKRNADFNEEEVDQATAEVKSLFLSKLPKKWTDTSRITYFFILKRL